jgi:hypothetical protein
MVRSILSIVAGIVLAVVVIFAFQIVVMAVYPLPAGTDRTDSESMKKAIAAMPAGAFAILLVGYAVGTCAGAWLAATIARRAPVVHGLIVGAFFLFGNIANVAMLPHPLWYVVVSMLLFLPVAWVGARWAAARKYAASPHAG